ncbi:BMP family ABC transporter substrate-binding protein [Agreia pratensis]|uniref:BMP family lipoprotein n=1 Tax=Microbacteriaceae TaxID=85023 RepID=UPI00188DC2BF|nr:MULTISPECIES: BMP family ABC transporter substrate-binding protein [Microbacteriaceae]MBF4561224.1 BMP family ABC transporter substrate-binding protein [Microbacterium sp. VKM Ac-2870]MBF4633887.1 BMP family ABC transporter substrate-binding protein [Agreia pratensis]
MKRPKYAVLAAMVVGSVVALTACSGGPAADAGKGPVVGLAYDIGGRGDQSFNDAAARGLDEIVASIPGAKAQELEASSGESDQAKEQRLRLLAQSGADPVIAVGFAYATPLTTVAAEFPDTHFAIVDSTDAKGDNVANLVFAEEQGSYLVGVAAALKSTTQTVGFIGGADTPLIKKFLAGYQAGVESIDPGTDVLVQYLSQAPDFSGFSSPDKAVVATAGMADRGADIIYAAAGGSGTGVFNAAAEQGILAIGVDSDQYQQTALAGVKDVILTSMVKHVDTAIVDFVTSVRDGSFQSGPQVYDLARGGVDYATSGGRLDDIREQLETAKQAIISGQIVVPTDPTATAQ